MKLVFRIKQTEKIIFLTSFILGLTFIGYSQETYKIGDTEYYYDQYYSTTGKPKVKRSETNKTKFLNSQGYYSTPENYEIDHIIPLSQGGSDSPSNMQLLTVEEHKKKTDREREKAENYNYNVKSSAKTKSYDYTLTPSYNYLTPSYNGSRTIHTGSRGGKYYINSNGNKTYVK